MLSTTNLMILRQDDGDDHDPYEAGEVEVRRIPIPGHISAPSGADVAVGGIKEVVSAVAYLPSNVVLEPADQLYEPHTGETYSIVWSRHRRGLGLDHLHVGLQVVKGGANG